HFHRPRRVEGVLRDAVDRVDEVFAQLAGIRRLCLRECAGADDQARRDGEGKSLHVSLLRKKVVALGPARGVPRGNGGATRGREGKWLRGGRLALGGGPEKSEGQTDDPAFGVPPHSRDYPRAASISDGTSRMN